MSQHFETLKVNDKVKMRGPCGNIEYLGKGLFKIKGTKKQFKSVCLIGGGTGITPLWQILHAIDFDVNDNTSA